MNLDGSGGRKRLFNSKIKVERASKSFIGEQGDIVEAIKDISLEVYEEELVSIVGPSGCGKTTLVRAIIGLEKLDRGEVFLNGKKMKGLAQEFGYVPQEFSLLPWRTVLENITFGMEIRKISEKEMMEKAKELIKLVGLEGFSKHYPKELSGGMKQKVAIARALAIEPSVLIMDEPFVSLDAQTRNAMQQDLLQIQEKYRKTVVFVTHNIDESVFLSDRIIILSKRPGTVKDIVDVTLPQPRDRTEAAFNKIRRRVLDLIDFVPP